MKITIDIEAKEIAELRALALPDERLIESKIINSIVSAINSSLESTAKLGFAHDFSKDAEK